MRARELMIGDWVIVDEIGCLTPIKVLAVGINYAVVFDDDSETMEDYLQPIPIAAEILEKNGFSRFFSEYKMRYYNGIISIVFSINKIDIDWIDIVDNEIGNIHLKNIRYVHELQHALRLCGLDDLADNFKI